MSDSVTPWNSAAVLVWIAPGEPPEIDRITAMQVQTPPHPNPVPFWRLRDAVEHATETLMNGRHAAKEPWIKVADTLYTPLEIAGFYRAITAERGY